MSPAGGWRKPAGYGCRSVLIAAAILSYVGVLPGLLGRLVGPPLLLKTAGQRRLLVPLGFADGHAISDGDCAPWRVPAQAQPRNCL